MNINCNRELLLKGVSLLTQIISQKPSSRPILQNILFSSKGNELVMNATDLEMGFHYTIPLINSYEDGETLLPAYQLLGILKETHSEDIRIEVVEKTAILNGTGFQFKLPAYANNDFPEVPILEGNSGKFNKSTLLRLIKEVSFAMNKEKNRYSLNSLLLLLDGDNIESVGTDQVRLAYSKAVLEESIDEEEKIILPAKSIPVITSILSDSVEEEIELIRGENQVTFKFNAGYYIVRLVDAQFPKYRSAFENYKDVVDIKISTQQFSHALRQVILLTCENAKNIALILEKNHLTFKASTPLGEGKAEVEVPYEGEEMVVGMNPYYVLDFLKEVAANNGETIHMKIPGPKKPIILYPNENYLYFMSPTII